MSDKILKKILVVISENFSNGVRADFITETQIRRAYKLRYGDEEIPAAFSIMSFIKKTAFYCGGKYYFVSALNKGRIFRLADMTLNAGNLIVYYDEFFSRYRGKFHDWHIKTPAVLGALLKTNDSGFYFADKYFSVGKYVRPGDVIEYVVRSLPSNIPFSVEQIHERLPYVPPEEIERVLRNTRKYLKTINGKYLLTEQVTFDPVELSSIRNVLLNDLQMNGHAIFNIQDFSSTLSLNPELSEATMRNVLFDRFLSKDFSRHGNVLTARGTTVSNMNLLKRFCALQDEIAINELLDRAKKLGINRQTTVFDAANETMTRVSKTVFVKTKHLKFNVSEVDEALNQITRGKIISLSDVTNFLTFAPVKDARGFEWEWNIYLLESFLRRCSRRYKIHVSATNPMNGAICPREKIFLNYVDLMSEVVLQEHVPLDTTAVHEFLLAKNFRARWGYDLSSSIIERAQVMMH